MRLVVADGRKRSLKKDRIYQEGPRGVQDSTVQIEGYLGRIGGIGPKMAKRVVDHFGSQALEVLEENPERLSEVEGFPKKGDSAIVIAWRQHREVERIADQLKKWGLKPNWAPRIFRSYGASSLETIEENPYRLALEVGGIDFKSADRVARHMGITPRDPKRLTGGILYTLSRTASEGNICLPYQRLLTLSGELLNLSTKLLPPTIEGLAVDKKVVIERLPLGNRITSGDRIPKGNLANGEGANVYLHYLYGALDGFMHRLRSLISLTP